MSDPMVRNPGSMVCSPAASVVVVVSAAVVVVVSPSSSPHAATPEGDDGCPGYSRPVSGGAASRVVLGLSAVIVAVTGERPRILTVGTGPCALPRGTLDPGGDA